MVGDVLAVLDDIGVGAVHVLGASLGGIIAQDLAVRHFCGRRQAANDTDMSERVEAADLGRPPAERCAASGAYRRLRQHASRLTTLWVTRMATSRCSCPDKPPDGDDGGLVAQRAGPAGKKGGKSWSASGVELGDFEPRPSACNTTVRGSAFAQVSPRFDPVPIVWHFLPSDRHRKNGEVFTSQPPLPR